MKHYIFRRNFRQPWSNFAEQKAPLQKSTPKNQVTMEARQHHRQRLVLAVLTVFRELATDHVVANEVW